MKSILKVIKSKKKKPTHKVEVKQESKCFKACPFYADVCKGKQCLSTELKMHFQKKVKEN